MHLLILRRIISQVYKNNWDTCLTDEKSKGKLVSTKKEYETFLTWFNGQAGISDDVKRIANIIHQNFDAVEATSSNQGQRTRVLVPIILNRLGQTSPDLPQFETAAVQLGPPWTRLRALTIGPFRGFRNSETFDLNKRIVLFYGSNGTGKTSLCEALEYSLLGNVEEANAKRIEMENYYRNVYANAYKAPILSGTDADGNEIPVLPNLEAYRFSFIEKNRIEAFSHIASKTPAQRSELIAALFGLEGFADFVGNFNNDINQRLMLVNAKAQELALKQQSLTVDRATVENQEVSMQAIEAQENALATSYDAGMAYQDLLNLTGSADQPGRLQELEQLIAATPPQVYGIILTQLIDLRSEANLAFQTLRNLNDQLQTRSTEVNYKSLYEALQGLEGDGLDYCPACTTPLSGPNSVEQNPFERARAGMTELAELAGLQHKQNIAAAELRQKSDTLKLLVMKILGIGSLGIFNDDFLKDVMESLEPELSHNWWSVLDGLPNRVYEHFESNISAWEVTTQIATLIESSDSSARVKLDARQDLINELNRLREFSDNVVRLKTLRQQQVDAISKALARTVSFDEENADLIESVRLERLTIIAHQKVSRDYESFLTKLRQYKTDLPRGLTADLSKIALELYNGINRHDVEGDKLAKLRLPTDENGTIQIAFSSHPDDLHNALQIMSEGHIRCLGLAILMAKNIKQECPVLIFDDAVNAIDDEHRLGLRDTLFDNQLLGNKQIIVTCHGEEFIKDIEVYVGRKAAENECLSYTFLPHEGDRVIRVIPGETRNYILLAQTAFNQGKIRESLGDTRRATEAACFRTWNFLERVGHGELKLKMNKHKSPIELHDLATELKRRIDSGVFTHERKSRLATCFQVMLEQSNWRLLNPGTHEEAGRQDFPRETVSVIIQNLAELDAVLSNH